MNHILARRAGAVAAALALGLAGAPAHAAAPAGVASTGSADFTKAGRQVVVPAQAQCAVGGPTSASSTAVSQPGIRFGEGSSTCTTTVVDPQSDTTETKSTADGNDFELSALMSAGGPRLKVGKWRISCIGKQNGTEAGWQVDGLSGFPGLPEDIPANYVHEVKDSAGTVLARVTFSEVILPDPNDGSLTMNLMHFRFTEASTVTGDVVVGSAACSPTP
ncbi:hypothetical protein FHS29_004120 [Saccharothrix tamanrassetensis]|uniref:Secreted protein n=1 Tax=Saccharothrix tamanrassetensis TaxID=1051531 RepID=A0A841CNG5_9PSEU|nr:hypothetical protein [Saccharothrix tamanrassetensis]MBB5957525.1 hypothetical protein [Saccharothrix tamanrassetensis]